MQQIANTTNTAPNQPVHITETVAPTKPKRSHEEELKRAAKRYRFVHSLYISDFTDWFLGFFGRSAQLILIITTLYQGAGLLPNVALPEVLTAAVFIIQMLALDIGGIGLSRIAKQARDEGDKEGAQKAEALSKLLIGVIIATLVTASLEQIVHPLPLYTQNETAKTAIDAILLLISAALTITRAICAVRYGTVLHALKSHGHATSGTTPSEATMRQIEAQIEALTKQNEALREAVTLQNETLSEAAMRQIEAASEAKFASFLRQSEALFEAKMRQRVVVSEAPNEAKMRQIEAPHEAKNEAKNEAVRQRREAKNEAPKPPQNVVPMRHPNSTNLDKRALIYQLSDQDTSASSYELAEKSGVPVSTVQRYLRERREALSEATGTDE